jgi:hypothetical protein
MKNLVAGRVCGKCNNGWMARLESAVRPVLLPLATGEKDVLDLSDEEALLVARWTAKTCICLHVSSNYRSIIPGDHIHVLDKAEYRLADNTWIVGHSFNGRDGFAWVQSPSWEIIQAQRQISDEEIDVLRRSGYKISLMVGALLLLMAHIPLSFGKPCLWKYRHVPLYPRWSHPVAWKISDQEWPTHPLKHLFAFHLNFGFATSDV